MGGRVLRLWICLAGLWVAACSDITLVEVATDADNDGYDSEVDCDDGQKAVFPGAPELCDELDNDCDEQIDEDVTDGEEWWADLDHDGWGAGEIQTGCDAPAGTASRPGDCDDTEDAVNPDQTEVCNGRDDDCNGTIDDNATDGSYFYRDADMDGWGDVNDSALACDAPAGRVAVVGDCQDTVPSVHPEAAELCNSVDDDCDLQVDESAVDASTWFGDLDRDSWGDDATGVVICTPPAGAVSRGGDCADLVATINPGAVEACNGLDDDCDVLIDEDATNLTTWYRDADSDNYGVSTTTTTACARPPGYAAAPGDCDDAVPTVNPAGVEICNTRDDDCDTVVDDVAAPPTWFRDTDGDGYGATNQSTTACTAPAGYVVFGGDCNEANAQIYPGRAEACNGVDDDCDTLIDDGAAPRTFYTDRDADGYGDPANTVSACTQPAGSAGNDDDCNDNAAAVRPGASEVCNGYDDDCDTLVDETGAATTWYADLDQDGYGDPGTAVQSCSQPTNTVLDNTDCDDFDAAVSPAANEYCNGVDDDCDRQIDEGVAALVWYPDVDGDGYGATTGGVASCVNPGDSVLDHTDCDDGQSTTHPGATELCNYFDDDCDGLVDENGAPTTYYSDGDGDGYGNPLAPVTSCVQPGGTAAAGTDCNDNNALIRPGATEVCNRVDDDCDTQVDEGIPTQTYYTDADRDTYGNPAASFQACSAPVGSSALGTDCNDVDVAVHPGATELCNGYDDDCDTQVDEGFALSNWYTDSDQDGYGATATLQRLCNQPAGTVPLSGDCNDINDLIYPGATETCDGLDEDCDGVADDGAQCDTGTPLCSVAPGGIRIQTDFESAVAPGILTKNGTATQTTFGGRGVLRLTDALNNQTGSAFFAERLDPMAFCATFSAYLGNGSGADGLTFAFLTTAAPSWLGNGGGYLGVQGTPGWAVELDTFQNNAGAPPAADPSGNHIAVVSTQAMTDIAANSTIPELVGTGWHDVEVTMDYGSITVVLDGVTVINTYIAGYGGSSVMFGFTGSTATFNDLHLIDDVQIIGYAP